MSDGQLYFGGEIYTVDEACPNPEAVAVRDGWIVAVGSESDCRAALVKGYESIDLQGRTLMPGFIDSHLHPVLLVYFEVNTDLRGIHSIKDLQSKMRDSAENTKPGAWVVPA